MKEKISCEHGKTYIGECVVCSFSNEISKIYNILSELEVFKLNIQKIIDSISGWHDCGEAYAVEGFLRKCKSCGKEKEIYAWDDGKNWYYDSVFLRTLKVIHRVPNIVPESNQHKDEWLFEKP